MVPVSIQMHWQAAEAHASPKAAYVSGELASATAGGPAAAASGKVGSFTILAGPAGLDAGGAVASGRIEAMGESIDSDGNQGRAVTVAATGSGPAARIGVTSTTSVKALNDIPMTRISIPSFSVGFGSDQNGNWALEAGGGVKGFGFEREELRE